MVEKNNSYRENIMSGVSRDRPGSLGTPGGVGSSRDRGGTSTSGRVRSTSPREGSQKKKKKKNPDPTWT